MCTDPEARGPDGTAEIRQVENGAGSPARAQDVSYNLIHILAMVTEAE